MATITPKTAAIIGAAATIWSGALAYVAAKGAPLQPEETNKAIIEVAAWVVGLNGALSTGLVTLLHLFSSDDAGPLAK
jgi:hypothetical protein